MSGLVKDNIFGSSGSVIEAAGGLSWQPVVTASTVTVSAGKGYFINTTSNACTITLPSSAEAGDQIILTDYARTWGTNAITIDSNGLLFQSETDAYIVDYDTSGQAVNLVYSGATVGWTPSSDIVNALEPVLPPTQRGMFAYGENASGKLSMKNLVNSSGVVAADVTGVGTARSGFSGAGYGFDKGIFAYGYTNTRVSMSNLVSNSGVIASDTTGVGTARNKVAAASYGLDKVIFAYGNSGSFTAISNLVSNSGVVSADVSGVGTVKMSGAAAGYGGDKAIFGFGYANGYPLISLTNLVNNVGVVAADTTGVGTARTSLGACRYGLDKAVFAYGESSSNKTAISNKVSNVGVVASDTAGVGTAKQDIGSSSFGGDQGIFGYGYNGGYSATSNKVSNVGTVASDTSGVGTTRRFNCGLGYSQTA